LFAYPVSDQGNVSVKDHLNLATGIRRKRTAAPLVADQHRFSPREIARAEVRSKAGLAPTRDCTYRVLALP